METGRESTRWNWRHRLRPARIDWDGYVRTVEAVRRAQWQVAGIARTLVDAADDADRHPAPSAALAALLRRRPRRGGGGDLPLRRVDRRVPCRGRAARRPGPRGARRDERGRCGAPRWTTRTPGRPTVPCVLEGERLARELLASNAEASVPTDTGPIRMPLAESLPAVGQLQQQVPAGGGAAAADHRARVGAGPADGAGPGAGAGPDPDEDGSGVAGGPAPRS